MSTEKYLNLRQHILSLVDSLQLDKATKALKSLATEDIPRELRRDFAVLARRSHLYNIALRILQPNVYGVDKPSQADVFEYASSIRKIGLIRQCRILLDRAGEGKEQELYRAYSEVHEWNYKDAKTHFDHYLATYNLSERERIVTFLNLVSCNIFLGNFEIASQQLGELSKINEQEYFQFYLNYRELLGQFYLAQGDTQAASAIFNESLDKTTEQNSTTVLFLKKWLIITKCAEGEYYKEGIDRLKREIRKACHWESLRDFDYHLARYQQNVGGLRQVYFNTPFAGYRERMERQTGLNLHQEPYFIVQRGEGDQTAEPFDAEALNLKLGMLPHRLLLLLLSDSYHPWSIPRIFDYLFAEEIYNPNSSPKKIYALTAGLQKSLEGTPLRLESTVYGYRLRLNENAKVKIYSNMIFNSRQEVLVETLRKTLGPCSFAISELEKIIPLSKHKMYRLIHDIEEQNLIEKIPGSARYKLKAG
ncbi:MAG: hypothetical protein H6623_04315 [Bdellovibrionaceae bacterium]|nr:hypothetical protein [Pseudobdellovibrionaceae bacterium]